MNRADDLAAVRKVLDRLGCVPAELAVGKPGTLACSPRFTGRNSAHSGHGAARSAGRAADTVSNRWSGPPAPPVGAAQRRVRRMLVLTGAAVAVGFIAFTRLSAVGYSPLLTVVILVGLGIAGTAFGSLVIASRGMADGDQGLVGGLTNTSRPDGCRRRLKRGTRGRHHRPFGVVIFIGPVRGRRTRAG